jgi:hypothetical protein
MVVRYQSIIAISSETYTNFHIKPVSSRQWAAHRPLPQTIGEEIQVIEKFNPSNLVLCF